MHPNRNGFLMNYDSETDEKNEGELKLSVSSCDIRRSSDIRMAQENLLDAIKTKFAAKSTTDDENSTPLSLANFTIPVLKSTNESADRQSEKPSTLNSSLMERLKKTQTQSKNEFFIPRLCTPSDLESRKDFQSSCLPTESQSELHTLTDDVKYMKLDSTPESNINNSVIDLTAALNCSDEIQKPIALKKQNSSNSQKFFIPFIECDLKDRNNEILPSNEYCENNVLALDSKKYLKPASSFGRIICLKHQRVKKFPSVDHGFESRNTIARFSFNTKSPDDLILETLQKYHRRQ